MLRFHVSRIRPKIVAYCFWAINGIFLLVYFGDCWVWLSIVSIPWLTGAVLIWNHSSRQSFSKARSEKVPLLEKVAYFVLVVFVVFCAWLFSMSAAILVLTCIIVFLLMVTNSGHRAIISNRIVGLAVLCASAAMLGLVMECVLSLPVVGAQWGSPKELQSWALKYDDLATHGNKQGFRTSYECDTEKPRGTVRLIALGDSFTWGDKIAKTQDIWPTQLEALFQSHCSSRNYDVVNLGKRSFTTRNEVEVLNQIGWRFNPDIVVLQYLINDAFPSSPGLKQAQSKDVFGWYHVIPDRFREGAIRDTAILAFLESRWNQIARNTDYSQLYRDDFVGWKQVKQAFANLRESCSVRNIPVLVVLVPNFSPGEWDEHTHPNRDIHEKVVIVARQSGLDVLDLTSAFTRTNKDGTEWWATPYDSHPNASAHALIAEEVYLRLKASLVE